MLCPRTGETDSYSDISLKLIYVKFVLIKIIFWEKISLFLVRDIQLRSTKVLIKRCNKRQLFSKVVSLMFTESLKRQSLLKSKCFRERDTKISFKSTQEKKNQR